VRWEDPPLTAHCAPLTLVPISCCNTSCRLTIPIRLPILLYHRGGGLTGEELAEPVGRGSRPRRRGRDRHHHPARRSRSWGWSSARVVRCLDQAAEASTPTDRLGQLLAGEAPAAVVQKMGS